ncbi:MAG: hypothetical protein HRU04_18615 [Oceanospirillaceae bacterium]|nr:hypothetical protein [Oceanospirillaceae bacterium]
MDKLTVNWHKAIVTLAERKLCRLLSYEERIFIESRLSYIALEMIDDSVKDLSGKELESYLNSE